MRSVAVVGLFIAVMVGCGRSHAPAAGEVVSREGEPDVIGVAESDAEMNAAMDEARSTLPGFLEELENADPGAFYSIKARFDEGPDTEHIWLVEITNADGVLGGVINNEPLALTSVAFGQRVSVSRDRVSDWLIVRDGKYRGGFTLRQLRKNMTAAEQRQLDEQFGAVPE